MRRAMQFGILGVALAVWGTGCAQQRKFEPEVNPNQLSDIQFLHYLETVPVITVEEGYRAMLICGDGEDHFESHAARFAELENRGWVRSAWGLAPGDTFDTGTMCYMVSKACDLKPSASSLVLGSWGPGDRRYAVRQCVEQRIIAHTPAYKPVTGGVMVWTMGKVDDYLATHGGYERPPSHELAAD